MTWLYYGAVALLAGSALALQVGVNNGLKSKLDQPIIAAIVSFGTGTLALIVYALITRAPLPAAERWGGSPRWVWLGGSLGAVYLVLTVTFSPKIGLAGWLGVVVAGQIITSVVLDHFGLVGFEPHPAGWVRVGGVVLLLAGAALVLRS